MIYNTAAIVDSQGVGLPFLTMPVTHEVMIEHTNFTGQDLASLRAITPIGQIA
jgi:hypothetical protein